MAENRVIGLSGGMPWHLPADLARFRTLTMGKPIIMGRRTYESLGRVLDGRYNIVLSRQLGLEAQGFHTAQPSFAHSLREAIDTARKAASSRAKEIAIIGGASVYEQALPFATHLHLTHVHATIDGDVRFPQFDHDEWCEVWRERRKADDRNPYDMSFIEYKKTTRGPTSTRPTNANSAT